MLSLPLRWHLWSARRKMNRVFSRAEDPYHYKDSPYEQARLQAMEAALGERRFRHALEVGCAEGAFTLRLASRAAQVTALELSQVALARARKALAAHAHVELVQTDVRAWNPQPGEKFDLLVLGDVLYYMDKPLVRDIFSKLFHRLRDWMEPGALVLLAHGFAGPQEKTLRQSYHRRFQDIGLSLLSESVIGEGEAQGQVCCLLSLLTSAAHRIDAD